MATSTNIKQWKIDFLKALSDYIYRINKRKEREIDPKRTTTGGAGSGGPRPELRGLKIDEERAKQTLLTFQSKLVEALANDGIENSIAQPIVTSYVTKVLSILMTANTTLLKTIQDWIKQNIDPLILPGA